MAGNPNDIGIGTILEEIKRRSDGGYTRTPYMQQGGDAKTTITNPSLVDVNAAHNAGAEQERQLDAQLKAQQQAQQDAEAMRQERIANQPFYQGVGLALARAAAQNKLDYEAANKAYASETDEGKKQQLQELMTGYHNATVDIRAEAARRGIDLSAYGSDVTAADAQAALANQAYRAYDSVMQYPMTSAEYYSQQYEALRDNGWGRDAAAAWRMASAYRRERVGQLRNTLFDWGIDKQRGALNVLGASIASQLAEEGPIEASGYTNLFANPKDEYTHANEIENLVLNNDQTMGRMALQGDINARQTVLQHDLGEKSKDADVRRDTEKYQNRAVIDLQKSQAQFHQNLSNALAMADAGLLSKDAVGIVATGGSYSKGGERGSGSGSRFDKNYFEAVNTLIGELNGIDNRTPEQQETLDSLIGIRSNILGLKSTPEIAKAETREQAREILINIINANNVAPANSKWTTEQIIQYLNDNVRSDWVPWLIEQTGLGAGDRPGE